jgi:nitroimidazol reductase NimA-like FMN-containing flavoprotein (pyridoxamine 5'-phosphate oxidase superfamily)
MGNCQLTDDQTEALLRSAQVGHLGTVGEDGFPYVTPLHFVAVDGCIYFHGRPKGLKLDNLRKNSKVCFEVESSHTCLPADTPCRTSTACQSVIIRGEAAPLADKDRIIRILDAIVAKYAPQHQGKGYPDEILKMTVVVEIKVRERTGKYFAGPA